VKSASNNRIVGLKEMSEKLANPAPLGLLAFGLTTVLLNLLNAGLLASTSLSMILAMGLAYGGLAQIIAGAMEFKKGNTFGMVAFSSYGFFWWSIAFLIVLPLLVPGLPNSFADSQAMAAYFFMWGLFTFVMFFGTLKANRAIQFVFMSLAILFFMLTASQLTGNATLLKVTGYEGVICGLSAVYLGLAEVLNEAHGTAFLPIGPMNK
jgi:succinate-acetate transporter protein